jgi:phosphoserine phosphatase
MDIALTLVVNPDYAVSLSDAVALATKALALSSPIQRISLKDEIACDLIGEFADAEQVQGLVTKAFRPLEGLDWAVQPAAGRKKKLILADMDSTMITAECIDELADFIGLKDKVSAITEAAMRGEMDFEAALTERVALLKGLSEAQLNNCYHGRIHLMAGSRTLVQTMKANGAYAALVSGGFTYFTSRVANAVGFDMHRANILELKGGMLSGKVVPPICGAQTKLEALNELVIQLGLSKNNVLAVGDGANDIPMLQAASLGVAYHAHPKTRDAASAAVTYGDLSTLLYFQGYKANEFID